MKIRIFILTAALLAGVCAEAFADAKPASIFGDGMVLQRDAPVKVWGTADKNEKVTVAIDGQKVSAKAGKDGKWSAMLKPMPAGGPYTMTIAGRSNVDVITNVLVGEVWLCSGQSNMAFQVKSSNNPEKEIAAANYPMIRCFTVERNMSAMPLDSFSGSWAVCSPETAGNFTAVGYFFARNLWNELQVPIGIINSSWGGTDIEPWTSDDSYEALPASVRRDYGNVRELIDWMKSPEGIEMRNKFNADYANDPALAAKWYENPGDKSAWKTMYVPKEWGGTPLANDDGHVWFRREITLPAAAGEAAATLSLGPVDDNDITWINGVEIGRTEGYSIPRKYTVAKGVLREGVNTVTVRVTDTGAGGGIWGKPEEVWLDAAGSKYQLAGEWEYRPSVTTSAYRIVQLNPNICNSLLYNAMINPMIDFRIKGAIWYQGENNANDAYAYRTLFPNMIENWRAKWGYTFPFYWVQLANYMAETQVPRESAWAELREAQGLALALPQTGQAVIIDIGDPRDIHPRNKQDVGRRLALNALAKDYGRTDIVWSGPTFSDAEAYGSNKMLVSFDTYGSQLAVHNKYGYVEGFAVAGEDRVFHWAKARIIGNGIVEVCSDAVEKPVAVRYAWSNDPQANLFNTEGLPAEPFRTDNWPGITVRKK